jgi:dimethylamine/trimethylamine dehydrogenase
VRDPKYDVLFEPVRIGPKTMKNRFYQTPHCTGLGAHFPGAQAHFRGMKAEGGWAVVNTEATQISCEDDFTGFGLPSFIWDDQDAQNWSLMVERVHDYGALAGIELHSGGCTSGFDSRQPARGISSVVSEVLWMGSTYEMDKEQIRELQQLYVGAAKRARAVGFDIVNVHGAEASATPSMFLMNYYNKRHDEYGGSLENRARFWLETLELVREAVGDECAVTARFSVDTLHGSDAGIRVEEEGVGFIELADHLVDFWDLQVGGENMASWMKDAGPSRFYPENFQGEFISKVRPHTQRPIVGVGRFTDPDTMVAVIRSGQLDIIGAARPSIADPFLPKKIEEGRLDEIRECIGCNVCVSRVNAGWRLVCTQNATTGEEYRRSWHPEKFDRMRNADTDVLVVGAGPAGLECAIVLGKRGARRVHLVEADGEIGGHLRWVSQLPGMGAWAKVINWRQIQLSKLRNVELITNTRLGAEAVLEYGANVVVLATGARWATDGLNGPTHEPIPGADATRSEILVPEQIMVEGKEVAGESVLVYDTEGYFMGATLAEKLVRDGHRVRLVTQFPGPAPYMNYTGENLLMIPMLGKLGVEVVPGHVVSLIERGRASGFAVSSPDRPVQWDFDSLVLVTQRVAANGLYSELKAEPDRLASQDITGLYRIGDCVAPRLQVADAIFDGHRLAREIDAEHPQTPLPYIREFRLLGATDADYDTIVSGRSSVYRPTSVRRTSRA